MSCRMPIRRRYRQMLMHVSGTAHSIWCSCILFEYGWIFAHRHQPSRLGITHQHDVSHYSSLHRSMVTLKFQTSLSWVFKFEFELSVTRLKSSSRVPVTRHRVTGTWRPIHRRVTDNCNSKTQLDDYEPSTRLHCCKNDQLSNQWLL